MRAGILSCVRVGSTLALMLEAEEHEVSVIDKEPDSRLGEHFRWTDSGGFGHRCGGALRSKH